MYKLYKWRGQLVDAVMKTANDGSQISIPFDPMNTDYQEYLKWVAEGNQPEPADE